eukprot:TRINITY_DN51891_c0_g1_i1.p1 TRINITY_DN51891_c0_g1~~TRINITY_DN51891_c0_g1_i1.p1  ORF type:complete len:439 (+),score=38.81 TRINITY_DN51891_c0_g1_i1:58-1374(+)
MASFLDDCPLKLLSTKVFRTDVALSLFAFSTPEDFSKLLLTTSRLAGSHVKSSLWHRYFVLQWGDADGVTSQTNVSFVRSWAEDGCPSAWLFAFGFCDARTPLDHIFWQLPFGRCFSRSRLPKPAKVLPETTWWQAACYIRARHDASFRVVRCASCDVLEVAPSEPPPQHFRHRWTQPCACCPFVSHRICLERMLLSNPSASRLLTTAAIMHPTADVALLEGLQCKFCGDTFRISGRFPETIMELVNASVLEWRWSTRRFCLIVFFYFWLYTIVQHYRKTPTISERTCIFLTAGAMHISLGRRLQCSVQKIWNTPSRKYYLFMFGLFIFHIYLMAMGRLDVSTWHDENGSAVCRLYAKFLHSIVGQLFFSCISFSYMNTAAGLIFLFWKTSVRVPTIASFEGLSSRRTRLRGDFQTFSATSTECGLCQLGLCLDNPWT